MTRMISRLNLRRPQKPVKISTDSIRQRIVGVDAKVPILDGSSVSYINFDNAASTPVLQEVLDEINNFMPWYSSVHRGTGFKSHVATQAYDNSRQTVADFFGANNRDHIVLFGKNTTEAINKLSYRLQLNKDDIVLVSLMEHHSNDLPWRKQATVKRIKLKPNGELDEDHFDELLQKYKSQIKLVAITGGSNVTGFMPNIHKMAVKTHNIGAQIFVDCAQLAPHRKVDIKKLSDPQHLDYIAVSAHKMYAPFGIGALIGRRDTFEIGPPEYCGGGTIDLVTTNKIAWAGLPDRDEAGSPNVVGAVAFAAALRAIDSIGMDYIAKHEAELTSHTLEKLNMLSNIEILGDNNPQTTTNRLGVIPFNVNGLSHFLVAAILGTEFGIGVRNGCFCAHPYITHMLGVSRQQINQMGKEVISHDKSHMPGLVRISFGMYNTKAEADKLIEALTALIAGNYSKSYRQEIKSGEFHAMGWEPELNVF